MKSNNPIEEYVTSKALTKQQSDYINFKKSNGLHITLKDFIYFHQLYLKEKQLEKNYRNGRT